MPESVQLMITCILDTLYPKTGEAVLQVLEGFGLQVTFPQGQTCCGQPAFNAGMRPQARKMAEHTIQVFEKSTAPIIIPSGSCAAMIRHGYLELFREDPAWLARARELGQRSYEFTEYLVDILGVTDIGASLPGKITYHPSCHLLRELGVDKQPRQLLASLQSVELTELTGAQECCGFGGLFSLEHPDISAAMLQRKLLNIMRCGADTVVSCDAGCITHINGGLRRQGQPAMAIHIAEVLVNAQTLS
ncbi:MAG TPA: (Fe-S)-binding protein [Anaerolineales bacterium]|nr:(Fe-S)-binding protein [Anaerolineales bacterium]